MFARKRHELNLDQIVAAHQDFHVFSQRWTELIVEIGDLQSVAIGGLQLVGESGWLQIRRLKVHACGVDD